MNVVIFLHHCNDRLKLVWKKWRNNFSWLCHVLHNCFGNMFKLVQRGIQWSKQSIASLFASKFEPVMKQQHQIIIFIFETCSNLFKGWCNNLGSKAWWCNHQIKLFHHYFQTSLNLLWNNNTKLFHHFLKHVQTCLKDDAIT